MKKVYALLVLLASVPAFADTTCSALCGYYSGSSLKLLTNPAIDATSWKNSTGNFAAVDDRCSKLVEQTLGEGVQHVLLAQKVIATSATTAATELVFARAIDSCRSER